MLIGQQNVLETKNEEKTPYPYNGLARMFYGWLHNPAITAAAASPTAATAAAPSATATASQAVTRRATTAATPPATARRTAATPAASAALKKQMARQIRVIHGLSSASDLSGPAMLVLFLV